MNMRACVAAGVVAMVSVAAMAAPPAGAGTKAAAKRAAGHGAAARHNQVIAYVFPQNRVLAADEVNAEQVTRVNYAFTNVCDRPGACTAEPARGETAAITTGPARQDLVMVSDFQHDAENYAVLLALKKKNPKLEVVPSVGGWTWSKLFSDVALTKESRKRFIDSVVAYIEKYKLDGLDIDWEYPAQRGDGNKFRPEDKHNYTLLLKELRARFDVEGRKLHKHLVTSIATGSGQRFLDNTEMSEVAKYVDSVNLMTYDMYGPGDKNTGHDSPLYNNPADPKGERADSVDKSVELYLKAGVPAEKIVVGVPFYSKRWSGVEAANHGLYGAAATQVRRPSGGAAAGTARPQRPANAAPAEKGYGAIVGMIAGGYVRYYDPVAQAPYLYNPQTKVWITYEDTESLLKKADYVREKKLGGMMFWEYTNDPSGMLLKAVNVGLNPDKDVLEAPAAAATGKRRGQ